MIIVSTAIQTLDRRTRQIGDFGYLADKPLYSVTPVFSQYYELINYMAANEIKADYDTREET